MSNNYGCLKQTNQGFQKKTLSLFLNKKDDIIISFYCL